MTRRAATATATVTAAALAIAAFVLVSGALAASAPTVAAGTASATTDTSATVNAAVNPNGQATTYAFEYGTTIHYSVQTAPQSAGAGTQPVNASAQLTGLRPGTTYHYRLIAASPGGTTAGTDATFTTSGIAAPPSPAPQATTGSPAGISVDAATLTGTLNTTGLPAGENETYYFQLGPGVPYGLQSIPQTIKANGAPIAVSAQLAGLASATVYHYRLVAVSEAGQVSVGADHTFMTIFRQRLEPLAVQATATPVFQRSMPDRVTVSGRLIPPPGLSNELACRGYFDITFRVRQIAVQSLRAGIHKDCTFSLPVVFHNRRRLMGGQVTVHVLFAGNRFLHRLEAPLKTIQVG